MGKKTGMDMDALRKEYQEAVANTSGGGGDYWSPRDAVNLVRILPDKEAGEMFFRKTGVHFNLLKSKMEVCPSITFNKDCPVCELVQALRDLNTPAATKLVNSIALRKRFLMNVVALDKDPSKALQYLGHVTVHKDLLGIILDEDYGDITNAETGRNIVIEKHVPAGDHFRTEYKTRAKPKETELPDMDILESMPDLDEFLEEKCKSYDEIQVIVLGDEPPDDAEETIELYKDLAFIQKAAEKEKGKDIKKDKSSPKNNFEDDADGDESGVEESWLGCNILYEDETNECKVVEEDGDDIKIKDGEGEIFDATKDQCTLFDYNEKTTNKKKNTTAKANDKKAKDKVKGLFKSKK